LKRAYKQVSKQVTNCQDGANTLAPVSSVPGLTIATVFSAEHRTRQPISYRRCRTVLLVSYCNSGSLVMHNLYWNHYIGFQLLNALTSNWQLWHSRYCPLLNLNTFVS